MLAVVLLIGAAVASALLVRFFRGPDRSDYLAQNERIVAELPLPKGAHERGRQILRDEDTVFGEQLSHTVGYTTYVTYSAPATMTSKDVVDFYTQRLAIGAGHRGWLIESPSPALLATAQPCRGNPKEWSCGAAASQKTYGIAANHRGGSCD